ncbi:MAG TPA: PE PGRS family protein, partial [Polyangiaceae bacterium]|nr:PE PGRS family protein [Polyangiaceae bacterium]
GMGGMGGMGGRDAGPVGTGGVAVGGRSGLGGSGGGPSGNPGTVNWGKEEDPSSKCTLTGPLPEYADLKADNQLPDPFMMLDGTRITNKSQWACRREEIRKQLFKYVFGEKPIPAAGSVSGTVTSSKISVKVSEGGKSCSFDATVEMNGATAPAPAIIIYDGGLGSSLPIPKGVAKITFRAIEGGAGAKTGPFFTFYGSNHPAGYMVAQAWQVSRIIDLLQQNPGTIDADHLGVTGCSRNGKGAFAGGVFDNRIALTIPCESGIGGTVGLRLKQQLDPGESESPYAAISYVRWLSDVALGPFTSGSSASADNTERLPVDMHEAIALIAPRALYIVDNPSILDPKSAYVTAMAGQTIFETLGVGDRFTYQGASGSHCQWRPQYNASLSATIDRFLKGNNSSPTGNFATDLASKPNVAQYYDWDATELPGNL